MLFVDGPHLLVGAVALLALGFCLGWVSGLYAKR